MPSERAAEYFATESQASSTLILARVLAKGEDSERERQLAVQLLKRFGSLEGLLNASRDTLLAIPSLTTRDVALLEAFHECVGMINTEKGQSGAPIFESLESLGAYIRTTDLRLPSIGVSLRLIMIDQARTIIGDVEVEQSRDPAHPARAVVMKVLEHGAAGVVMVWLQASTNGDVGKEFGERAKRVNAALNRLEVPLLDCALLTSSGLQRVRVPAASR